MHIQMILIDMLIFKLTKLKDVVKVSNFVVETIQKWNSTYNMRICTVPFLNSFGIMLFVAYLIIKNGIKRLSWDINRNSVKHSFDPKILNRVFVSSMLNFELCGSYIRDKSHMYLWLFCGPVIDQAVP